MRRRWSRKRKLRRPIYYTEDDTPAGLLIEEQPDGRRELVKFDEAGDQVIRAL